MHPQILSTEKLMTAGLAHGSSLALPQQQLFGNKSESILSGYVQLIQRPPGT